MVGSKTKNPLRKRYLRDLKGDPGKYLALFLLLFIVIGEVSGFFVADGSMQKAYQESFDQYNVEYGHFTAQRRLNKSQKQAIEELGVGLNELFFDDVLLSGGQKLRLFKNRTDMNRVCIMKGRLAEKPGEIAIDRLFADNNKLALGDVLSDGDREWTVTGLVALSDYSSLFENNSDAMFDSLEFGVSVVSDEEFEQLPKGEIVNRYAWRYNDPPEDEKEEKVLSDDFRKGLSKIVHLEDYVPRYLNQAVQFAGEDMGDDKAIMTLFLYVSIVILAFVFGVTISNTIIKEAGSIGTLRASGYTRFEMIRHYIAMPVLVTLAAALAGNIMGYTLLKNVNAELYYSSYSLPVYKTLWNANAFVQTTVIPVLITLAIEILILWRRLALRPLQFLRRDLTNNRRRGALKLNNKTPFFSRFRIRVILQNIPDYIVLFVGIIFAELLLMFGLFVPENLQHYQDTLPEMMLAKYQYILMLPEETDDEGSQLENMLRLYSFSKAVETGDPDAEKFMVYTLRIPGSGDYKGESVLIYGIDQDSSYVNLSLKPGETFMSSAYADKFKLKPGEKITLFEEYEDKSYSFDIDGIYEYDGALALFMPAEDVNEMFGFDKDMFAGYFTDTEITDISEDYIGQVIDLTALSKVSRQLMVSMGGMMKVVVFFSILVFLILMYVISKIMIEKNAQSISMTKILGYTNREIRSLYVRPTSMVTVIFMIAAIPLVRVVLKWLYEMIVASKINGWVPFYVNPWIYLEIIAMGLAAYAAVSVFEFRRIRKIPKDEILKNVN